MRIEIEAEPNELVDKSENLAKAFIEVIAQGDPVLADTLEKSMPGKQPELKYPVLRGIHEQSANLYQDMLKGMLSRISDVMGRPLTKSSDGDCGAIQSPALPYYDHSQKLYDKDAVAYRRIRLVMAERYGYTDSDFDDKDGQFYGYSVNQLREYMKNRKAQSHELGSI